MEQKNEWAIGQDLIEIIFSEFLTKKESMNVGSFELSQLFLAPHQLIVCSVRYETKAIVFFFFVMSTSFYLKS